MLQPAKSFLGAQQVVVEDQCTNVTGQPQGIVPCVPPLPRRKLEIERWPADKDNVWPPGQEPRNGLAIEKLDVRSVHENAIPVLNASHHHHSKSAMPFSV